MDKNQIGTNAGIVWNILKDNAHWEYEDLKAATGLSDRELNAAIGWLAREDKIDFDMDQNHESVGALADTLRQSKIWYFWWD